MSAEENSVDRFLETSPEVSDEIHHTTCYMCACRCGINVHMKDDKIRYIEGNRDHPVNRGVLCAKGSAGIMQQYSPAKLRAPLKRVGERGSGEFVEISWEEALSTATQWLSEIRHDDPKKLAFFTGRDQSQSMTSWWAQQFGTPNYAAHGGFCSVNMAAAGIYTIGGAFWEFGQPDWDHSRLFMIFGIAEDHDSNPIKLGLAKLKERGAKIVAVNPVRTGYNAIADEWLSITPGTDGLLVMAIIRELINEGTVDLEYLLRYSNASWLVIDAPNTAEHGLFARDENGAVLAARRDDNTLHPAQDIRLQAALSGEYILADGRKARPSFALLAEEVNAAMYDMDNVAQKTGIPEDQIRGIAHALAEAAFSEEVVIDQPWTDVYGEKHDKMIGRPVSFHAMRGISAHSNGFQTCRAIHLLQILLGSIDCPGGFRYKPPYPKPSDIHPTPCADSKAFTPLAGAHLGYIHSPEELLLDENNKAKRIDKAYSWDAPFSAHGLMHMVISNAYHQDPYPVDMVFMYMANMAWNSSMNTKGTMEMLKAKNPDGSYVIPKILYSDAYSSEMVAFADLILPDTTYLERFDCISLLDRPISEADAAADAIRWPVIPLDRDVRGFQSVLLDLGARLGLPAMTNEDGSAKYKDYADYIVNHERKPGVGPLAGFRGENADQFGTGAPNPNQLEEYKANGSFCHHEIPPEALYFKHANQAYQDWAVGIGLIPKASPVVFQLYLEPMAKFQRAAEGFGEVHPPEHLKERVLQKFTPFPHWYAPDEETALAENHQLSEYPYHAITQRPAAMYHSWGSQNAWLRQIHTHTPMFVPEQICRDHGLKEGDWAWIISHHGKIKVPVKPMKAVNPQTLWTWNAIGKRKGAWALQHDAPETERGFLLNHLIKELLPAKSDGLRYANSDPITGQGAWYDLRVRIEKAEPDHQSNPQFAPQTSPVAAAPSTLRYESHKDD